MTQILFAIASVLSITCCGQDTVNHFTVVNGGVVWVNSFPSNKSLKEVYLQLKASGNFSSLDSADNKIFAEHKWFDADFKGAGYKRMVTPIYILESHLNGFSVI